MKRGVVMGLVFVLLSFSLVLGCDDSQRILRLSDASNAHGELWGGNNYNVEICHDEIFGFNHTLDSPHACSEKNGVLHLYRDTNAHGELWSSSNYNTKVCYGDLECEVSDSDCKGREKLVVSLSSETNAHLSNSNDYPKKICCKSVSLYWAGMDGKKITKAQPGDKVQLIAKGISNFGDFQIKEKDILGSDDIIKIGNESFDNGFSSFGVWEIKLSDLDGTNDYDEFYFEKGDWKSNSLKIEVGENENDRESVSIVSPVCGEYYDINKIKNIVVLANDPDDRIYGNVSVNGVVVKNFTNGGVSFPYKYNVSGNIQVVVNTINDRGGKGRTVSNIMVLNKTSDGKYVDDKYVAACIAEPRDFSMLGKNVNFNASTTRGINVSNGILKELIPGRDKFNWHWVFNPGEIEQDFFNSNDRNAYIFRAKFPSSGKNTATLLVTL